MKVGLLTFHYCYNYGAALQCLGLYQTLKEMGHDVDVIDYQPIHFPALRPWQGWGLSRRHRLLNIKWRWATLPHTGQMRDRFDRFIADHVTLSPACDNANVSAVVSAYDAIVVGSDQVWNCTDPKVTPVYFLDFPVDYRGRRISYAACCGHNTPPRNPVPIANALKRFDFISLRNKVSHDWLQALTDISAEIVCDPTLLKDYAELESAGSLPYERYLLVYVLGREIEGGIQAALAQIQTIHGPLPVVLVRSALHPLTQDYRWADKVVFTAGPAEWLQLMTRASFIFTDSFHGTTFAIKYRKQFFAYYREPTRAPRLLDLAKRYGVESVIAGSLQEALSRQCFQQQLDYSSIERRVAAHRAASRSFLQNALA